MGIAAKHLESGRTYEHLARESFEGASVTKIAVLTDAIAAVHEKRVDLAERWTLTDSEKADGSGLLLMLDSGLAPTWNDLLDADDRAVRQHRDKRLDPPPRPRSDQCANGVARLSGDPRARVSAGLRDERRGALPLEGAAVRSLVPAEVAVWYERVAREELLDPESSDRIFGTSTRTRAAFGSRAASPPRTSGPERPER
jgi:hypothetical protein